VILVDDGIAIGSTMLASVQPMGHAQEKEIIIAALVASTEAYQFVQEAADERVFADIREDFLGVGMHYAAFRQTEDQEVIHLLDEAKHR